MKRSTIELYRLSRRIRLRKSSLEKQIKFKSFWEGFLQIWLKKSFCIYVRLLIKRSLLLRLLMRVQVQLFRLVWLSLEKFNLLRNLSNPWRIRLLIIRHSKLRLFSKIYNYGKFVGKNFGVNFWSFLKNLRKKWFWRFFNFFLISEILSFILFTFNFYIKSSSLYLRSKNLNFFTVIF